MLDADSYDVNRSAAAFLRDESDSAIPLGAHSIRPGYWLAAFTSTRSGSLGTGGRRIFCLTVGRRLRGDIFTSTQRPLLIERCIASMMRTSARPSAPLGSGVRLSKCRSSRLSWRNMPTWAGGLATSRFVAFGSN